MNCVCGVCSNVVPSDLQFLTDENIEELGSAMTHVEKMRLQAALRGAFAQASARFVNDAGLRMTLCCGRGG